MFDSVTLGNSDKDGEEIDVVISYENRERTTIEQA